MLWGMIVFGRGVVEVCGGVGTGAMFAVGVTCGGEGVACAGDRADADDEDDAAAAAMAAAAATAAEFWRSVLTAMMLGGGGVGVELASGDTTIVEDGVG